MRTADPPFSMANGPYRIRGEIPIPKRVRPANKADGSQAKTDQSPRKHVNQGNFSIE
jgi:hypothetical protein